MGGIAKETRGKRLKDGVKGHGFFSNLRFMLGNIAVWTKGAFVTMVIRVPVLVWMPLLGVYLPKVVVQGLTEGGEVRTLIATVAGMAVCMMALSFLDRFGAGKTEAVSRIWSTRYYELIYRKQIECDYELLEDKKVSGIIDEAYRAVTANERLQKSGENLVQLGANLFGFIVYLSILRRLSPILLLWIAATGIVSVCFADMGGKHRLKASFFWGPAHRKLSYLTYRSAQARAGKDIRLYAMRDWFYPHFIRLIKEQRKWLVKVEGLNGLSGLIGAAMALLRDGAAYLCLIWQVLDGRLSPADFVLYFGAVAGFSNWVVGLAWQLSSMYQLSADIDVVRRCLELESRSNTGKGAPLPEKAALPCEIVFDHVSYRYPGSEEYTIKDLNFTVKASERLALVGLNGAGKTTCVKLLCGLYMPTQGRILINGISSREYSRDEYFTLFSTLFQDVHLLPMSIRENVTQCGKEKMDREWYEACVRMAELKDKINSLPQGEETLLVREINENAVSLSGGEIQRLLLARALYKKAPILVLDEPTAALDPILEDNVYLKYRELTEHTTSLFISHRLASTRFCDRILFMENGKIAEEGSHEELMALHGKYANAFEIQSYYYREQVQEGAKEVVF